MDGKSILLPVEDCHQALASYGNLIPSVGTVICALLLKMLYQEMTNMAVCNFEYKDLQAFKKRNMLKFRLFSFGL